MTAEAVAGPTPASSDKVFIGLRRSGASVKALRLASVQERLAKLGVEPMPMNLDEFDKFFRDDVSANVQLVKAASIPTQ